MNPTSAILVFDRDALFRGAIRNYLLGAGFSPVETAATLREALARLHRERYRTILLELSRQPVRGRRLAAVAKGRQPAARVIFLVRADDRAAFDGISCDLVIKELVFSNLLELL